MNKKQKQQARKRKKMKRIVRASILATVFLLIGIHYGFTLFEKLAELVAAGLFEVLLFAD